jgi:hypothetical protein
LFAIHNNKRAEYKSRDNDRRGSPQSLIVNGDRRADEYS